jgi:hypothetical protein
MLPGRVRVRGVEEERLQDCPGGGPRPGLACGREEERDEDRREELTTHRDRLSNREFDIAVVRGVNAQSR